MDWLRAKGIAKAAKKSSRIATEGMVHAFISADATSGSLIEINCETDFVGKTAEFQVLLRRWLNMLQQHQKVLNSSRAELVVDAGQTMKGVTAWC